MYVRLLALLLAVLVSAGIAAPTVAASPDVAGMVDDDAGAPDPDPVVPVAPVVLEAPAWCELRQIVALPTGSAGRRHQASVFRPPRPIASR